MLGCWTETAQHHLAPWLMPIQHSQGLGNASSPKPETHLPLGNYTDQPVIRPGPLVQILTMFLYHWTDCPLGGLHWWDIQKEEVRLRPGSGRRTTLSYTGPWRQWRHNHLEARCDTHPDLIMTLPFAKSKISRPSLWFKLKMHDPPYFPPGK